jgi:hypothetical protein
MESRVQQLSSAAAAKQKESVHYIAYESIIVELEEARIELEQSLQSCVKLVKVKAKRLEQGSKKSVPPAVLVALATEGNTSIAMGLDYFGGMWGVPSK